MIHPEEVKSLLIRHFPGAEVSVADQTGTMDHFDIHVISKVFEGKTLIEQHRMVQVPLEAALTDGRIHAVQIKTRTSL
ncbi:MAG: BolA family transcriptional regulator [Candidatus Omnitrophica bacterium CG11_big_fil_rev_8_21_14_0_20_45_26]|uniref:BolA family transcriptional regulator n=1 Tax=Candidatus Abzuiibacterium crystallinum TaxID=1974748 RepID=A0A2H0LRB3_9BACT|nr:MAG: BolA family transcriptional regulator [Candidatus Omnitrophica bacterium CG11_big_fil_rev_8_21_14_0_20_45_26]PIW64098.1 MAG: BolA family transcriptional regulator [Candidatus Omnitrophica bacterium CG12_big_fil_rev_8_21_14_0_65_45_16]